MTWNNKTYQAVADGIAETRHAVSEAFEDGTALQAVALAAIDKAAEKVCEHLAATHRGAYSFKEDRFLKACGVKE